MANFVTRSLMGRLVTFFLLVSLAPVAIVGFLSFQKAKDGLMEEQLEKLRFAEEQAAGELLSYFKQMMMDLDFLSKVSGVQMGFQLASSAKEWRSESSSQTSGLLDSGLRSEIDQAAGKLFKAWEDAFSTQKGYRDLLIVSEDGLVAFTLQQESDQGKNVKTGALKDSGLGKLWAKVMKTGKPAVTDFSFYEPSKSLAAFAGVPVTDNQGKIMGVFVAHLTPEAINSIFSKTHALGRTAEAYVVGPDLLMRSNSRFETESAVLRKKVETEAIRDALAGKRGVAEATNYRGVPALASWRPVGLREDKALGADFDWALVAEIDMSEVREPAVTLATWVGGVALAVGLLAGILALLLARSIARPVTAMAEIATQAIDGNLTLTVPDFGRNDEIGALARAFDAMMGALRVQIGNILGGVSVLSASAAEISTTVSQLSMSAAKTAAAVTQTSTTVEEVKQAAKVASDKAKQVAEMSQKSVQISDVGRQATEDTVHRINLIKEQMESVGETVVRLSEHSQAIEEIIGAVQDLADQSNLLAVNASIEAARAGDQGKGFAVVAQEIKTLADQSRESTEQVRNILHETRKWVSAVVMATEQGIKAVEAGASQSTTAGESIQTLAGSVVEASQAAAVIGTSMEQQFVGVDQVASAMVNIEAAMRQHTSGADQLQTAAKRLEDLGRSLKDLVEKYKT